MHYSEIKIAEIKTIEDCKQAKIALMFDHANHKKYNPIPSTYTTFSLRAGARKKLVSINRKIKAVNYG